MTAGLMKLKFLSSILFGSLFFISFASAEDSDNSSSSQTEYAPAEIENDEDYIADSGAKKADSADKKDSGDKKDGGGKDKKDGGDKKDSGKDKKDGAKDKKDGGDKKDAGKDKKGDDDECFSFCDGKFKVGADILYWEAVEGGLTIGNKIIEGATLIKNIIIRPKFGADIGYKVSVGYEFPHEQKWDLTFSYGYLPFSASTGLFTTNNANPLKPTEYILLKTTFYDILSTSSKLTGGSALSANYATMQGDWKGAVQGCDITVGRKLPFFDGKFTLRPQLGARARWGRQTYNFGGEFLPSADAPPPVKGTLFTHIKQNNASYSGTAAIAMTWEIGCGFSLVGSYGGSAGYSAWKMYQQADLNYEIPDIFFLHIVAKEHDKFPSIGFGIDYYAGIEYNYDLCKRTIKAKLLWESHTNAQNVLNSLGGNLGTQGITAGLQFTF